MILATQHTLKLNSSVFKTDRAAQACAQHTRLFAMPGLFLSTIFGLAAEAFLYECR